MSLILLNEEKYIIPLKIDETDIRLRESPFSTDEKRDGPAAVSDSGTFFVTKSSEQLDSEVVDSGLFSRYGLHGKIEEIDELGVSVRQHIIRL